MSCADFIGKVKESSRLNPPSHYPNSTCISIPAPFLPPCHSLESPCVCHTITEESVKKKEERWREKKLPDDAPCSVARGMNERRREEDEALERQREEVDSVLAIFEGDEKIRIETSGGGSAASSSKLTVCVHARFQVETEETEKTKKKTKLSVALDLILPLSYPVKENAFPILENLEVCFSLSLFCFPSIGS